MIGTNNSKITLCATPSRAFWSLRALPGRVIALHHAAVEFICRPKRHSADLSFAQALAVELTWLSETQRAELELAAFGPAPTQRNLPDNVIDFARRHPDRTWRARPPDRPPPRWSWATALVASGVFLAASPVALYRLSVLSGGYTTGVGERRTIPLDDGTVVTMNTQSRVRIHYSQHGRDIDLLDGEVLFAVAHDTRRPFKVHARGTVVEAVGTAFNVYLREDATKVSVVEGRVKISPDSNRTPLLLNADGIGWVENTVYDFDRVPAALPLGAGEEVHITRDGAPSAAVHMQTRRLASGELERELAWVDGQVALKGETLTEAVATFNRYNRRKLVIQDPAIANLRVGGYFKSVDPDNFVAALHGLFGIRALPAASEGAAGRDIWLVRGPRAAP